MRFQKHEGVGLQESLGELTFEGASLSQGQQPCALKRAGGQRAVTWCPCVRKLTGVAALWGIQMGGCLYGKPVALVVTLRRSKNYGPAASLYLILNHIPPP